MLNSRKRSVKPTKIQAPANANHLVFAIEGLVRGLAD